MFSSAFLPLILNCNCDRTLNAAYLADLTFTGALYIPLFGTESIWRKLRMAKIKPNMSYFQGELECETALV